jgi:transposase
VERSRWRFLWLLARGFTAKAIAHITGYSAYWIGQIARCYNVRGPEGVKDQRHLKRPRRQLLTAARHEELRAALSGPAPQYDRWTGRTVAAWMAQRLGRPIRRQLGWVYVRRLDARLLMPRPRHVHTDPQAQAAFKAHLRPLLREVATAFRQAAVELWAVDEQRIGLKPILRKIWSLDKERPIAPVQHLYDWR